MPDIDDLLTHLSAQLAELQPHEMDRRGSRFVGQGASPSFVERVAAGEDFKTMSTSVATRTPTGGIAAFMSKALAEGTPSSGGYLVPIEYTSEVLKALRARSAVMRLGPTIVPVEKELDITSLSTGATASYVAENARIAVSEQTFAESVLLRPRDLAALVPVSNRLLRDAASNRRSRGSCATTSPR
jgi:HK97 family phage major capsid protein